MRKLQKRCSSIYYTRPHLNTHLDLEVSVFADASKKSDENGQLRILKGLLIGDMKEGSAFYITSWLSHKSKIPVKSIRAAEIIAAAEGIDEGKMIAYSETFRMKIPLRLFVDYKGLFTLLCTQRLSIERSIRGDVGSIRFEFQTGMVPNISWIPGKINTADGLSKRTVLLMRQFRYA